MLKHSHMLRTWDLSRKSSNLKFLVLIPFVICVYFILSQFANAIYILGPGWAILCHLT